MPTDTVILPCGCRVAVPDPLSDRPPELTPCGWHGRDTATTYEQREIVKRAMTEYRLAGSDGASGPEGPPGTA
jgi:hypothetical protein